MKQAFCNALIELWWNCSNVVSDLFLEHELPFAVSIHIKSINQSKSYRKDNIKYDYFYHRIKLLSCPILILSFALYAIKQSRNLKYAVEVFHHVFQRWSLFSPLNTKLLRNQSHDLEGDQLPEGFFWVSYLHFYCKLEKTSPPSHLHYHNMNVRIY